MESLEQRAFQKRLMSLGSLSLTMESGNPNREKTAASNRMAVSMEVSFDEAGMKEASLVRRSVTTSIQSNSAGGEEVGAQGAIGESGLSAAGGSETQSMETD